MAARILTQQRLLEAVQYDPDTGKITKNNKSFGSYRNGYLVICIDGMAMLAHRAAWVYVHGDIDENLVIDHINRVRDDNRISNLRLVTHYENAQNKSPYVKNTKLDKPISRLGGMLKKQTELLDKSNWFLKRFEKTL